jgi:UrcA family protein
VGILGAVPSHAYLECIMITKLSFVGTKPLICLGALAACAVLSSPTLAKDYNVTVRVAVSTAGLDLSRPDAAHELYGRLSNAARVACGHGNRADLEPVGDFVGCYEKALGAAVRSVNRPQLTLQYLATHTLQNAATHGIDIPLQVAAR